MDTRVIYPERACGHSREEMMKCRRLFKPFQSCGLCGKRQLWPYSVLKCSVCSFKMHKKCADKYFAQASAGDGILTVARPDHHSMGDFGGQFGNHRVSGVRRPSSSSCTTAAKSCAIPEFLGIAAEACTAAFFRVAVAVHASLGEVPVVHRLGLVPDAAKHFSSVYRTALFPESDERLPMTWPDVIHSPTAVVVRIRRAAVVPPGQRVRLPWSLLGYPDLVRCRDWARDGLLGLQLGVEIYLRRDFAAMARRLAVLRENV